MKIAKAIYSIICLLFFTSAAAQECEWLNVSSGVDSESAFSVTVDNNDDIIVGGSYIFGLQFDAFNISTPSYSSGFIIKYSPEGLVKWVFRPTSLSQWPNGGFEVSDIEVDDSNNIYAFGRLWGTIDFGNGVTATVPGINMNNVLLKLNSAGVAKWAKVTPLAYGGIDRIAVDHKGNVFTGFHVIAGFPINSAIGINLCKYSSSGTLIRSDTIFGKDIVFYDVNHDADDNIYVLAYSDSSATYHSQAITAGKGSLVLKTDSAFNTINSSVIDCNINIGFARVGSLHFDVTEEGNFAIVSHFRGTANFGSVSLSTTGDRHTFVAYYNPDFTLKWAKKENSSFLQPGLPMGINIRNNNIYFGGMLNTPTSFGNFNIPHTGSISNLYFVKADTLGNFLWAFGTGTTVDGCRVHQLSTDALGNCIVVGDFGLNYTSGPVTNHVISIFDLTRNGSTNNNYPDFFVAKIANYSITRGNVSPGPYCAGDIITIPYTKVGKYDPGNEFIAQLSDSAGNFEGDERELGRVTDTAAGVINGILPMFNVATSKNYRIRILSTKPGVQSFYRKDTLRLLIYSKDTANAGPDITLCKGQGITLSTTGGSRWNWSPHAFIPDPEDTARSHPFVRPDSTTEYRIIISDSSGCGVTDTDYVKINVRPALDVSVPDRVFICLGRFATIKATAFGGDNTKYNFSWTRQGDKTVLSTTDELKVKPTASTRYWVKLTDSCTQKADSAFVTIIPQLGLSLLPSTDTTICVGHTVSFDARAITCDTTAVKYVWSHGLGTGPVKTVSPGITTTYKVVAFDTINNSRDSAEIKVTVRQPLQLALNNDTALCMGNSLQLKTVPQGGLPSGYKILWTDDRGPWTDTNFTITVNPTATTTYTAILRDNCTLKPDTAKVVVTVRDPLKITLNNDTTICLGETAQLRATTSGGQPLTHNILWTADSGPWTDANKITTVNPSATTTYKAVLTDNCTVNGDSATVKVTVRTPLSLSVNPDATICTGQTTQLKVTPSGGLASGYNILWTADSGPWTDSNFTLTVAPAATTTYKAVLTDNCTTNGDSTTVTITVRPPLSVSVNPDDSICQNQTVLLTATISGGNTVNHSILWTVDRGPWTSLLYSITDTPQVTSTYIAILSDNCSTPASDTVLITVLPSPKADFDFFPKQGCPPLEVSFTDLSYSHDTTKNIWKIQANDVFGVSSHTQLFPYTGTYDVGLTVINALNCSDNIVKKGAITVFEKPKAAFTVKPDIIEAEKEIYLINQSQRATVYTWDMNDGSLLNKSNLNDTTYSYKDTGNFTISLIAENIQGCKDTAKQNVRIHDRLTCIIPNAFTPSNYDDLNSTFSPVCTGLKNYTLTIYNRWGQAIHQSENSSWDGSYEGEIVPQGIYMYKIQIQAENGRKETLYGTVNVLR